MNLFTNSHNTLKRPLAEQCVASHSYTHNVVGISVGILIVLPEGVCCFAMPLRGFPYDIFLS